MLNANANLELDYALDSLLNLFEETLIRVIR